MAESSIYPPKINNIIKKAVIKDGEYQLINDRFAFEFGTLNSNTVNKIPDSIKVAIGISVRCFEKMGIEKGWEDVLQSVMNNPSLEALDVKDMYHNSDHEVSIGEVFDADGQLKRSGVR